MMHRTPAFVCCVLIGLVAPLAAAERYSAMLAKGTLVHGDEVRDWHDTGAQPKLGDKPLLDAENPLRWLKDNTLPPAAAPEAYVEMVGGDRLPGEVVGHRSSDASPYERMASHLLVEPSVSVEWPDPRARRPVRVLDRWLRRVVWQPRGGQRYQPGTLFQRDGRQLAFRSLRWSDESVRLLLAEGTSEVHFSQIAELHLPRLDPWDAYYEQLALLSPDGSSRLVRMETSDGVRLTGSTERFQARNNGSHPDHWYHALQPAWCLDMLWLRHRTIRLRSYFEPHQVPLSLVEPSEVEQKSALSAAWNWQLDRNVQSGPLRSGDRDFGWGLGVHAQCRLTFELPRLAKSFRTSVGIDEAAGHGGCAQVLVYLGEDSNKPLFKSDILVGSEKTVDVGPLEIKHAPPKPASERADDESEPRTQLTLLADPVHQNRPQGADPLDIRDLVDWLEPQVELDAEALREKIAERAQSLAPALAGWAIEESDSSPLQLVNYWDDADKRALKFQTLVLPRHHLLSVSRLVEVDASHRALLLAVSRPPKETTPARVIVEADGQVIGQFDVPERRPPSEPEPLWVPLDNYLGRQVTLKVTQPPLGPKALIDWRGLLLVDRWPGLLPVFEDEASLAETLAQGGTSAALEAADAYSGEASLKISPVDGADPHRLDLELRIREHPKLGEFRYLRFAWKKLGGGRICCSLGHDDQWGTDVQGRDAERRSFRYDAGGGEPSYGAALRLDKQPPKDWAVVTRDLYGDFGEFTLSGISFSAPEGEGNVALFDHVYLGRSPKDFERIETKPREKK